MLIGFPARADKLQVQVPGTDHGSTESLENGYFQATQTSGNLLRQRNAAPDTDKIDVLQRLLQQQIANVSSDRIGAEAKRISSLRYCGENGVFRKVLPEIQRIDLRATKLSHLRLY